MVGEVTGLDNDGCLIFDGNDGKYNSGDSLGEFGYKNLTLVERERLFLTFDVTRVGYDGGTDATDHLVWWIQTPSEAALKKFLNKNGNPALFDAPEHLAHLDWATHEDGIDLVLDTEGEVISWKRPVSEFLNPAMS